LRLSGLTRLVLRLNQATAHGDAHGLTDGQMLAGPPVVEPLEFLENGLRFTADLAHGQKTGFFFDQRDNRAMVESLAAGKSVLNAFAYTGACSLYAARGGATSVTSLDASRPALEAAVANFTLNRHVPAVATAAHELVVADAFQALSMLAEAGRRFDMVITDPPPLARNSEGIGAALAAYRKLTAHALSLLNPGGLLVAASCTARVPAPAFFQTVRDVAEGLRRGLHTIAETGQPVDHPITFKEGAYLKCLFAIAS
jgi:23S rRNA (cytosine1962-C5)-methyltransferase